MSDTDNTIPYKEAPKTFYGLEVTGSGPLGLKPTGRLQYAGGGYYDRLATIFAGQWALMDKYYDIEMGQPSFPVPTQDYGEIDFATVQARLHELFGFAVRELSEAMQELRWKPWKQKWTHTSKEKFIEEMGDALHFYVEMCITAGISAEDLFNAYFRAWSKNRDRQANGYSDPGSTPKA